MALSEANKKKFINLSRQFIGTPYQYGARPEEIPQKLDCSSFTQYVYKQTGINLERSSILQAAHAGQEIELPHAYRQAEITPCLPAGRNCQLLNTGDLLFFRGSKGHYDDALFPQKKVYIGHVAIYTENNNAIHASYPEGVIEESVNRIIKKKGPLVIIKRIL